jgi:TPP-dependent pyruvate/acetoin dehydrogenase alpha subunit
MRLLRERMLAEGIASADELNNIDREVQEETNIAVSVALLDPWPHADEALRGVFA